MAGKIIFDGDGPFSLVAQTAYADATADHTTLVIRFSREGQRLDGLSIQMTRDEGVNLLGRLKAALDAAPACD